MKKFFVIIFVMMSLMVCGCSKSSTLPSNSFSLQTKLNVYGGMSQTITFPTLFQDLKKLYDEPEIDDYLGSLESSIESEIYNNLYLKYWLKYLEDPNKDFIIGGDYVNFERPSINEQKTEISFSLNFSNSAAWRYYNSQGEKESEDENDDGFYFLSKTETKTNFPFSEETASSYLNVLTNTLNQSFLDFDLNKLNLSFSYHYITPYSKLRSNADVLSSDQEGYRHVWVQKQEELKNQKEIKIWINTVNKGAWYLLVLGITTLLLAIILLILKFSKINKKDAA